MTASNATTTAQEADEEVVTTTTTKLSIDEISKLYFKRLQLDPAEIDEEPTLKKLQQIFESHLTSIPFENIAQHSYQDNEIQRPDLNHIIEKVLVNNHGGFCLELNVLLAHWLTHGLGYKIHLVPAIVGRPDPNSPTGLEFDHPQTHILPFCRTIDDNYQQSYIADVALGESAIYPLQYTFDLEQITPENMKSKIELANNNNNNNNEVSDDNDIVTLYWCIDNVWKPRVQWKHSDATKLDRTAWTQEEYQVMYDLVQIPASRFTQKFIISKLTRYYKYTVAGTKYKITGPPRFLSNENGEIDSFEFPPPITVMIAESILPKLSIVNSIPIITYYFDGTNEDDVNQLRIIIQTVFGIPERETKKINFIKSSQAGPEVWGHL